MCLGRGGGGGRNVEMWTLCVSKSVVRCVSVCVCVCLCVYVCVLCLFLQLQRSYLRFFHILPFRFCHLRILRIHDEPSWFIKNFISSPSRSKLLCLIHRRPFLFNFCCCCCCCCCWCWWSHDVVFRRPRPQMWEGFGMRYLTFLTGRRRAVT